MRITIVGGGNIGTQFAVHCAEKGHEVTVYTSRPDLYDGHLSIVDEMGNVTHEGRISLATDDPEKAFADKDLLLITVPAMMMNTVAELVEKYADCETRIGVVPGNGGSECAFKRCIEKGNIFFGIERVPAIARLVEKGKTVKSVGYRDELHVAAIPRREAQKCAKWIEGIFDIRCTVIPNFLNLTMTPSNPILHTSRLKTLFGGWHEGVVYETVPLFYEEWNDASSELLIACDEEVQSICRGLPDLSLQYVKSLRVHYESADTKAMTEKIRLIPAFKGLASPVIEVGNGFIPNLHSRYFTADFSFGLSIIEQIARFADVKTPVIHSLMEWYRDIAVEKREFLYSDYGITDRDAFVRFYLL